MTKVRYTDGSYEKYMSSLRFFNREEEKSEPLNQIGVESKVLQFEAALEKANLNRKHIRDLFEYLNPNIIRHNATINDDFEWITKDFPLLPSETNIPNKPGVIDYDAYVRRIKKDVIALLPSDPNRLPKAV